MPENQRYRSRIHDDRARRLLRLALESEYDETRIDMLRRTKIPMPKTMQDQFPDYGSLRIGVEHSKYLKEEGRPIQVNMGDIYVFLVPEKGTGDYKLIARIAEDGHPDSKGVVEEARRLARDPDRLEEILERYKREGMTVTIDAIKCI